MLYSFMMARHRSSYEHPADDDMNEIIGNGSLSEHFLELGRDLDVMEAKVQQRVKKTNRALDACVASNTV